MEFSLKLGNHKVGGLLLKGCVGVSRLLNQINDGKLSCLRQCQINRRDPSAKFLINSPPIYRIKI
jgi:hypothetical protein